MNVTRDGLTDAAPSRTIEIEAIYLEHGDWILGLCRRWLGNRADAEDACQETFLRAAASLHGWRGESSLRWWLAVIARNTCQEMLRRRPPTTSLDAAREIEASPGADCEAERRSLVGLVHGALATLPARDRDYVVLADLRGRSYAEIAALDGTTLPAVRTRLMRARRRLRDAVTTVAKRERVWPLPVVFGLPGRVRSWWHDRPAVRRLVADASCSSGTSFGHLSAVLTPSFGHMAVAVGLILAPSPGPSVQAKAESPDSMERIANVGHDAPRPWPSGSGHPQERALSPPSNAAASEPADAGWQASMSPSPHVESGQERSPRPIPAAVASPHVTSNTEAVVSKPVQTESEEDRRGYYVTVPGASVDIDDDGKDDVYSGGAGVGLGCAPGEHQGPVTKAACDNAGLLPAPG